MGAPIILAANVYEAPKLMKEGATLGGMAILSGIVAGIFAYLSLLVPHALFPQARIRGDEPVRLLLLGGGRRCLAIIAVRLIGARVLAAGPDPPYISGSRRAECGRARGRHGDHRVYAGAADAEETEELRRAVACLEGTSFAQRLTDAVGRPVGVLSRNLPAAGPAR